MEWNYQMTPCQMVHQPIASYIFNCLKFDLIMGTKGISNFPADSPKNHRNSNTAVLQIAAPCRPYIFLDSPSCYYMLRTWMTTISSCVWVAKQRHFDAKVECIENICNEKKSSAASIKLACVFILQHQIDIFCAQLPVHPMSAWTDTAHPIEIWSDLMNWQETWDIWQWFGFHGPGLRNACNTCFRVNVTVQVTQSHQNANCMTLLVISQSVIPNV